MSSIDPKWDTYCGLTCQGGSEEKSCDCIHPNECELKTDPEFATARARAMGRMNDAMHRLMRKRAFPS